jgi:hypothetical protein
MNRLASMAIGAAMCAVMTSSANAIVMGLATPAQSFTITSSAGGWNLVAAGTVDITALSATSLTLHVVLRNQSTLANGDPISPAKNVRLSSWGFGVDPNATAIDFYDSADGGMVDAALAGIPNLSLIEVCAFGGPNCNGGGNGGIWASGSDEFDLTLIGSWGRSVTFDPLGVKMQTTNGSYEFSCTGTCDGGGGRGGGDSSNASAVPEPQTALLAGLGLLSLAFLRRRQRA